MQSLPPNDASPRWPLRQRNREIAEVLFVTPKTVEVHLGRIYAKLGIKGRSQSPQALGTDDG